MAGLEPDDVSKVYKFKHCAMLLWLCSSLNEVTLSSQSQLMAKRIDLQSDDESRSCLTLPRVFTGSLHSKYMKSGLHPGH